jgi:oxygen-independent coproporphyrinogen-3 oxidase
LPRKLSCRTEKITSGAAELSPPQNSILTPPLFFIFTPPVTVWSWLKPKKKKFSSITRHHYVGFGPSAASMTGTDFYVNTFDVKAYAATLPNKRPVVLSMPVDRRLEMAYWLYWRVYELKILNNDFQELFGSTFTVDSAFSKVLTPFEMAGMVSKKNGGYSVTESGAYWIHRLQNEYSLNYINRLWGSCRREAWPSEVFL